MSAASLLLLAASARADEPEWPQPVKPHMVNAMLLADQLEVDHTGALGADIEGWIGGDFNRLRFRAETESALPMEGGSSELQAMYSRLISPWWELQAGVRMDLAPWGAPPMGHAAFGIEGSAPYKFDVEATLFLSQEGDPSASFSAIHEQLYTQRLIGQARADASLALGESNIGASYRLRYELRRELAPYLGVTWTRPLLSQGEVSPTNALAAAAGVRLWW